MKLHRRQFLHLAAGAAALSALSRIARGQAYPTRRIAPSIVLAAALFASGANAQVTALTHATVIDGTGAPAASDVTILMENGRIRDMGAAPAAPAGATVVDLAGKFVVPGIINAHGHVGPAPRDPQLRRYALYGVTTTTSMSFDDDDIAEFKARQQAGDLRGARILTVKYRFMSPPFHPGSEYKTPAEGRAKVDEIVAQGTDFVKVWIDAQNGRFPKVSRDFVAAVFDEARKFNKLTMAHIVELADARMVVDEGVDILAHDVRDQEIPDDFIETLKRRNVSVVSTLAREEGMFVYGNADPGFTEDPFFRAALTPEQLAKLAGKRAEQANEASRPQMLKAFDIDKLNVKKLSDAGVRLGFGTDSGGEANRYFVQGFSEHRQMDLLLSAGLTPRQIIQAWSKNNSELLGIDRDFGTLAKGKAADLLVVARNPLQDIDAMHTIDAVYLGGRKFE
jgi:imidazolonepropionase-like amidohydrolase